MEDNKDANPNTNPEPYIQQAQVAAQLRGEMRKQELAKPVDYCRGRIQ